MDAYLANLPVVGQNPEAAGSDGDPLQAPAGF